MTPRTTRTVLALAVLAGFVGYRALPHTSSAGGSRQTTAAPPARTMPIAPTMLGTIAFTPCSLGSPQSRDSLEAQCGRFEVPEGRGRPGGRTLALNIAWLQASERGDVAPDPVFFIAGGPGQSAVETYPAMDPVFREVRRHRHVILVDQRGTGKSNRLSCDVDDAEGSTGALEPARGRLLARTRSCLETLSTRADLRRYTTTDAVADLDAIRQAIGAARINLVGVSYGTRVAQQYAMRHPQSTRSIVLDSVVPNTLQLGNIFARNLDDALTLQFALCSKDAACREKLGDPRAELNTLLASLDAAPRAVRYRDATTGEWTQGVLRAETVAGLVRMYAYMPLASSLLPKLIHEANAGHVDGLMALAAMLTGDMKDALAVGMQLSVVCSEDRESMVARAEDASTVLGNLMPTSMAAMCDIWPAGEVPADFHTALATPVPALVLEGEFDPITPPRYGEDVVKTLSNGRLFVLRGQGHGVAGIGCMPKLFTQFVEKADAKALDGRCLETLGYAAPFTSFNGTEP